jgi:hypothetical protein
MIPAVITENVVAIHLVATKMDAQYGEKNAKEMLDDVRGFLRNYDVIVSDFYTSAMTCYNVEQPFITNCDDIVIKKVERLTITSIKLTEQEIPPQSTYDCVKCGL